MANKKNKASDTGEQVVASSGKVGEPFFFPQYQKTIIAASLEEALQQLQKNN